MGRMLLMANKGVDGPATQNPAAAGGLRALTQLGGPTQVAAWQTQRQTQAAGGRSLKHGQAAEQELPEMEAAGECRSDLLMLAGGYWSAGTCSRTYCTLLAGPEAMHMLSCVPCCVHGCAGVAALLAACPTFEAFWQGRLIPGACVDTLPFIRAVRSKRSAAAKDLLPDDVFGRIR